MLRLGYGVDGGISAAARNKTVTIASYARVGDNDRIKSVFAAPQSARQLALSYSPSFVVQAAGCGCAIPLPPPSPRKAGPRALTHAFTRTIAAIAAFRGDRGGPKLRKSLLVSANIGNIRDHFPPPPPDFR